MSLVDSVSADLGFEDNRLKALIDRRTIKIVVLILLCALVVYLPLRISADRSGGTVVSIKRGGSRSTVNLILDLFYEDEALSLNPDITVLSEGEERREVFSDIEQKSFLEAFADKLIRDLSNDSSGSELILPSSSDGVEMRWSLQKADDPVWIFALALFLSLLAWFSRHDGINRRRKKERNELITELPNMILQLVLLLNSGLIADAAFEELIRQNQENDNYMYKVFRVLKSRADAGNNVFIHYMYSYAKDFDDREFLRFATLCAEHAHRGSELAGKLEQERSQQWNSRLSRAKSRAKEAETKLCFPLMLLLIALVVICIAPTIFEM